MRCNVYVNLRRILLIYFLMICSKAVYCDLPVHCKREQIEGDWIFRINNDIFDPSLNDYKTTCGHGFPDKIEKTVGDINYSFDSHRDIQMRLGSDYKVYDKNSKIPVGSWTPVYDEGFILYYKEQVFTAFMKYFLKEKTHMKKPSNNLYSSNCKKTMIGWYIANKASNNKDWSCFFGFKSQIENEFINEKNFLKPNKRFNHFDYVQSKNQEGNSNYYDGSSNNRKNDDVELDSFLEIKSRNKSNMKLKTWMSKYEEQQEIVKEINENNLSWKAEVNEEFKGLSFMQLKEKIGMKKNNSKFKDYFSDIVEDLNIEEDNNYKNWGSSTSTALDNLDTEINDDLKISSYNPTSIMNSFVKPNTKSNYNRESKRKEEENIIDSPDFESLENNQNKEKENTDEPLLIGKKIFIYKSSL